MSSGESNLVDGGYNLSGVGGGVQEDQVERLLESAVAKSERPWLILLSGLATVIVALLIYVGLVVEGRI